MNRPAPKGYIIPPDRGPEPDHNEGCIQAGAILLVLLLVLIFCAFKT